MQTAPSGSISGSLSFVEHHTPAGICRIPIRSARAAEVAQWFGLNSAPRASRTQRRRAAPAMDSWPELALGPGTITFLAGASGSGKSSLLRWTRERSADVNIPLLSVANVILSAADGSARPDAPTKSVGVPPDDSPRRTWIDLAALALPDVPLVDCFGDELTLEEVLMALSRVGLGEAWSYLRTPAELSEGQRWRLRLGLGLRRAAASDAIAPVIVADEFCALLDRVTAYVVARCLRKAVDANPRLAALLAASQDDLLPALRPEHIIHCDFGRATIR